MKSELQSQTLCRYPTTRQPSGEERERGKEGERERKGERERGREREREGERERERGREGGRKGEREREREGEREGGKEGRREGGREGEKGGQREIEMRGSKKHREVERECFHLLGSAHLTDVKSTADDRSLKHVPRELDPVRREGHLIHRKLSIEQPYRSRCSGRGEEWFPFQFKTTMHLNVSEGTVCKTLYTFRQSQSLFDFVCTCYESLM